MESYDIRDKSLRPAVTVTFDRALGPVVYVSARWVRRCWGGCAAVPTPVSPVTYEIQQGRPRRVFLVRGVRFIFISQRQRRHKCLGLG
jgi:hypothetical protein